MENLEDALEKGIVKNIQITKEKLVETQQTILDAIKTNSENSKKLKKLILPKVIESDTVWEYVAFSHNPKADRTIPEWIVKRTSYNLITGKQNSVVEYTGDVFNCNILGDNYKRLSYRPLVGVTTPPSRHPITTGSLVVDEE